VEMVTLKLLIVFIKKKIISKFKFNNIYLISQDNKSPIIQKLFKDYPKIKYNINSKETDIALLMNAYNLVIFFFFSYYYF